MLTDFQNYFISRLSRKFLVTKTLNITSHLKRVATLSCQTVMFKNRNNRDLWEDNCHTRLSHSKHLLKNVSACYTSDLKEVLRLSAGQWPRRPQRLGRQLSFL